MQNELSGYVGCDVMEWIKHRQVEYGNTYPEIAGMLSESGWEIKPTTVQRWVSFERNRR
jgi:hypothetical protein